MSSTAKTPASDSQFSLVFKAICKLLFSVSTTSIKNGFLAKKENGCESKLSDYAMLIFYLQKWKTMYASAKR